MILDIVFGLIIVIFFLIGKKRGFVVEFFGTFKYLIILYTMKFLYPTVEKVFKLTDNNIDHLKKYFISFLILYVILSILLRFSNSFLKTIKLKKFDDYLGGFIGIIKSTFVIFLIYIAALMLSSHDKRIEKKLKESYGSGIIVEYLYPYSEIFPEFIKTRFEKQRRKEKEKKLRNNILNEIKSDEIKEKDRDENN
ncbi:MAG: CvpA family protein [Leptotrichiaceae bacterium]|nr:CvpA family protein [Leptotrichiaceae bacterium]MBP9875780.1 CvpA family protein [Leptotrichiaceae bacterium]